MLLLNGEGLSKAFGTKQLFKELSVSIFSNDRIGLIGQNGSGKSTFLKILAGLEKADSGVVSPRRGLKIGYVEQSCEFPDVKPIEILQEALGRDIPDYEREQQAEVWMSKLGFTGSEPSASKLSGGWKKRLMVAKAMILQPDLLFLDEPTNHLDLEGILWLEKFLKREAPTYLLVSHDRYFLQHMTNRIIEIGFKYPKGLFAIDGSYGEFLTKKEEFLQGQLEQEHSLHSKVKREQEWLRSNPKARTTKSTARIDQAHELIEDLAEIRRRNQTHKADIELVASLRDTRKLLVATNIGKSINNRVLFQNLTFILSPGTRIGLMGPNGSGKTTLLRLLAGEIQPDSGTIKRADNLQTVYFDQERNKLPNNISLRDALSPTGDFVNFRGQSIHVNGWCKRFLFSPDLLDMPIGLLSGGERARIVIAHLMLQPADVLLLDEPTNDLDIPTLETLESNLLDFPGAVVLITHDRCMLDRICNSLLEIGMPPQTKPETKPKAEEISRPKSKLSYLEKKEYDQIESKILKLEEETKKLTHLLDDPALAQNGAELERICSAIALAETAIEKLYLRFEELASKKEP